MSSSSVWATQFFATPHPQQRRSLVRLERQKGAPPNNLDISPGDRASALACLPPVNVAPMINIPSPTAIPTCAILITKLLDVINSARSR